MVTLELNNMDGTTTPVNAISDDSEKKGFGESSENTLEQTPTSSGEVSEKKNLLATLCFYENWLDRKFGFEHHAFERVTLEKKENPSLWALFFIWSSSGVYGLTAFSVGLLPWAYGLSLKEAILIQMAGMLLGSMVSVSLNSSACFIYCS